MIEAAGHMGWTPSEFWRSTYYDFTAKIWQRIRAAKPKKRVMSGQEVAAMLMARVGKG